MVPIGDGLATAPCPPSPGVLRAWRTWRLQHPGWRGWQRRLAGPCVRVVAGSLALSGPPSMPQPGPAARVPAGFPAVYPATHRFAAWSDLPPIGAALDPGLILVNPTPDLSHVPPDPAAIPVPAPAASAVGPALALLLWLRRSRA